MTSYSLGSFGTWALWPHTLQWVYRSWDLWFPYTSVSLRDLRTVVPYTPLGAYELEWFGSIHIKESTGLWLWPHTLQWVCWCWDLWFPILLWEHTDLSALAPYTSESLCSPFSPGSLQNLGLCVCFYFVIYFFHFTFCLFLQLFFLVKHGDLTSNRQFEFIWLNTRHISTFSNFFSFFFIFLWIVGGNISVRFLKVMFNFSDRYSKNEI